MKLIIVFHYWFASTSNHWKCEEYNGSREQAKRYAEAYSFRTSESLSHCDFTVIEIAEKEEIAPKRGFLDRIFARSGS